MVNHGHGLAPDMMFLSLIIMKMIIFRRIGVQSTLHRFPGHNWGANFQVYQESWTSV